MDVEVKLKLFDTLLEEVPCSFLVLLQELTKKLESNTPATADLKIAVLESKIQVQYCSNSLKRCFT